MRSRILAMLAASTLVCSAPAAVLRAQESAAADKWQSVARTDHQEAFVNTGSITPAEAQLEAKVKQNFAVPQPSAKKDKTYLSSRTTYRFDCVQRRMAMKEIRTYSDVDLQGEPVQKATSTDKNLQWLDVQESTVFGEVLDYVCGHSPGG